MSRILSSLMLCGWFACCQFAVAGPQVASPEQLQRVLSDDPAVRAAIIAELRKNGPASLPRLFELRDKILAEATGEKERLSRVETAIDEVAAQRHACHSRLYWYTDLNKAKQVAAKEKKPILSLWMLGNLNEDFSCANSRFFRTTLYANAEISQLLRDKFVLHWKSVRPVPKVTIDFGDGRKLERTLTGNSIHYVLAADGQIIDALPGLYGPAAFIEHLNTALNTAVQVSDMTFDARMQHLVAHHRAQLQQLETAWAQDYQEASRLLGSAEPAEMVQRMELLKAALAQPISAQRAEPPQAAAAARVAAPKWIVEMPLVRAAIPARADDPVNVTDERLWKIIAELHVKAAKLDEASLKLIRSENPIAAHAARLAITKRVVEDPLVRLVRSLESSIAIDTVRNEYQFHRQIHNWLAEQPGTNVEVFNERVYAQLFLTPSSDPWLGLAPVDAYTALPNGGVAREQPQQ